MDFEQQRQQVQKSFAESGRNIEVGDLKEFPLTLAQLKATNSGSDYVVESFNSGLTAVVHHLQFGEQHWTLKLKRPVSLVKNIDGQTSFLNEVQRRRDLTALKQSEPHAFENIVDTQFASFTDGIILSPWIAGESLLTFSQALLEQIFSCIINLELNGLFEWDLCPGNILVDTNNIIKLFDFGYMYQFDPAEHFNSNGQATPLFHGIERFETRFFFDYLMKNPLNLSEQALFELYRQEKQCALTAYQYKLQKLRDADAQLSVINRQLNINLSWEKALGCDCALRELYLVESFRSNVLDLLDDLHGQSCTAYTLKKVDLVLTFLSGNFEQLNKSNAFFFGDEKLTRDELITKYTQMRKDAQRFQLNHL
ncbi:hypothetical protein [Psychromonas ossibalaenae]|uniref:hypothetical protein n=1 Tax=Psychromonas ossibalaenae TaxID=444922 RepID=UPI000372BC87|nr:hypothetical protein [Psychromonas ossibalaenae]